MLPCAIKKFTVIAILFILCQGTATAQESAVQPKGYYTSDFVIDGIPRNITFYIPAGYGKNDTYPLVFVLHAEGETGKTVIKRYGDNFENLADSATCIIVFPDAVNGHWNTKMGPGAATDTINDAGFANIMTDYFIQQYKCDPDRVFATGFYSGGQMAWRLGCDVPGRIAAVAPFVSSVADAQKNCSPTIPYFNAEKYTTQPVKKISNAALSDAFNFLLQHGKK
jgi:polyhydroxybutyrate depolymerase